MRSETRFKFVLACIAALGVLAVGASVASAESGYISLCSGAAPAICNGGNFGIPFGLGVDNSSGATAGDVYVANIEGFVTRFSSGGEPAPFTGTNANISGARLGGFATPVDVAVESATGDFYVTSRPGSGNAVEKFSPAGEPLGSFTLPAGYTEVAGIAVDNSGGASGGDLWVANASGTPIVAKFTPAGTLLTEITTASPAITTPYSLAVDAHGNVYVDSDTANAGGNVEEFSESGAFKGVLDENGAESVAVDPSSGHIFVVDQGGSQIQPYTATGEKLTSFGSGTLSGFSVGIGVYGVTHSVYVTDLIANKGDIYGEGEAPPAPTTDGATEVNGTTAVLHGTVKAAGENAASEYHFEYNTGGTCTGGVSTAPENVTEAAVKTEVTGLAPRTEYTFCVVATNPFGSTTAANSQNLTTIEAAPTVAEEAVEATGKATATLTATVNPGGALTTCEVEYGLITVSENETACPALAEPEAITGQPVTVNLTGLTAKSEYHYRFVASNVVNPSVPGTEESFETKPLVEGKILPATEVTAESAVLNGEITTGPGGGSYQFEYGINSPSEHKTELVTIPGETMNGGFTNISVKALSLKPGETYHVLFLVFPAGSTTNGVSSGEVELTAQLAMPKITQEFTQHTARTSTSLWAKVNPENIKTTYFFEYGLTTAYESSTARGTLPAKILESVEVGPDQITALEIGTVYHYRLVASNSDGTTLGPDETFTTTAPTPPIVLSESSEQVAQTTATIATVVNPNGLPTSYVFEVGTEVRPGEISYTPSFGEVGTAQRELTFPLASLQPATIYHYRIVATNEDGNTAGPDQTFTTPGFPAVISPPPPAQIVPVPKPIIIPTVIKLTNLQRALKLCKKQPKKKRASCDKRAEKRFGPKKKAKKK